MMSIPQLRKDLEGIGSQSIEQQHIANLARSWVNGGSIEEIAKKYFGGTGADASQLTHAITDAGRAIYCTLANYGTWGLAALSKMPTAGLDFSTLPAEAQRAINNLLAMLYHGVNTEEAVIRSDVLPLRCPSPHRMGRGMKGEVSAF